jgi:hypothetical protein
VLRDPTGEQTGRVIPLAGHCKPNRSLIAFAAGQTRWCLELLDVAAGQELTGVVQNAKGDALALTVQRRDAWWCWPFLTLLAGLLVGLFAAIVPVWLRSYIRRLVLKRLLAVNNASAGPSHIDKLEDWVVRRQTAGEDREVVIAAVNHALVYGPELAKLARADLQAAIAESVAISEMPKKLLEGAQDLTAKGSPEMTEFYSADGGMLSEHPAQLWARALVRASEIREELAGQEVAIADLPESARQDPRTALAAALERFRRLDAPVQVERMDESLEALAGVVAVARTKVVSTPGLIRAARQKPASIVRSATRGALGLASRPIPPSLNTLRGQVRLAVVVTVAVGLVALAYASVAIYFAVYEPDPLFHSFADYLILFSTALGSGAASSVLALAGNWRATRWAADG